MNHYSIFKQSPEKVSSFSVRQAFKVLRSFNILEGNLLFSDLLLFAVS